ncbi:hypothetical protein SSS_00037 [Sarcoptes scabiei]|uniref:Uncharacterized protein n=1 Tax=Sarcoptes scabiei TaxID=52283 RepID=A0A834RA16_SARSC|nr:hypothetical protein SSS_00037 [Sarcoptes scabiei]
MQKSIRICFYLILLKIFVHSSQYHIETNPIVWRSTAYVVVKDLRRQNFNITLQTPCQNLSEWLRIDIESYPNDHKTILQRFCLNNYRKFILKQIENSCDRFENNENDLDLKFVTNHFARKSRSTSLTSSISWINLISTIGLQTFDMFRTNYRLNKIESNNRLRWKQFQTRTYLSQQIHQELAEQLQRIDSEQYDLARRIQAILEEQELLFWILIKIFEIEMNLNRFFRTLKYHNHLDTILFAKLFTNSSSVIQLNDLLCFDCSTNTRREWITSGCKWRRTSSSETSKASVETDEIGLIIETTMILVDSNRTILESDPFVLMKSKTIAIDPNRTTEEICFYQIDSRKLIIFNKQSGCYTDLRFYSRFPNEIDRGTRYFIRNHQQSENDCRYRTVNEIRSIWKESYCKRSLKEINAVDEIVQIKQDQDSILVYCFTLTLILIDQDRKNKTFVCQNEIYSFGSNVKFFIEQNQYHKNVQDDKIEWKNFTNSFRSILFDSGRSDQSDEKWIRKRKLHRGDGDDGGSGDDDDDNNNNNDNRDPNRTKLVTLKYKDHYARLHQLLEQERQLFNEIQAQSSNLSSWYSHWNFCFLMFLLILLIIFCIAIKTIYNFLKLFRCSSK